MRKSKMIKLIISARNANSEDDYDDLLEIMHPENYTDDEMEEIYEDQLGYNPLRYFDDRHLKKIYSKISNLAPIKDNDVAVNQILSNLENTNLDLDFVNNEKDEVLGATVIINMLENQNLDNIGQDTVNDIFEIIEDELDISHSGLMFCLKQNFELRRYSGESVDDMSPFAKSVIDYYAKKNK